MCKQTELDAAVQKAAGKKAKDGEAMSDDERRKLLSTEQSLGMEPEPKMPTAIEGLETLSLTGDGHEKREDEKIDAESFFNLPAGSDDDDDDDEDDDDR